MLLKYWWSLSRDVNIQFKSQFYFDHLMIVILGLSYPQLDVSPDVNASQYDKILVAGGIHMLKKVNAKAFPLGRALRTRKK